MQQKTKETLVRLILLFIGLVIAHLGVTLFLLADSGADPFNVMIQGLRLLVIKTGLFVPTHGIVHMFICFLIILILLIVDRSYIKLGTIVCMFCGGPIIDFFTWLLSGLKIGDAVLPVKIAVLIIGCGILAFGMSIVIKSEAGTGPNDLVAVVISDKRKIRFAAVRITTDTRSFPSEGTPIATLINVFTVDEFHMWLSLRMSEVRGLQFRDLKDNTLTVCRSNVYFDGKNNVRDKNKTYKSTRKLTIPDYIKDLIMAVPHEKEDEFIVQMEYQTLRSKFY